VSSGKTAKITIAPPHSIFFISDPDIEVVPKIDGRTPTIWATSSCLVIGCLMFQDGTTDLTLLAGEEADRGAVRLAGDREFDRVFDGMLQSPGKRLVVSTSEKQVLLKLAVPAANSRIRVWTNHPTEPEKIVVLVN
jgi:hypothetical protein